MESFIVRIYRRDARRVTKVEGVVEKVGEKKRRPFHSLAELFTILRHEPEQTKPTRKVRQPVGTL